MSVAVDDLEDIADAVVSQLRSAPADVVATVIQEGWHLLGVSESDGGFGGDAAVVADIVAAVAANGLSAPMLELHLGTWASAIQDEPVGVTWWDGRSWRAPWGYRLETAIDLRTGRRTSISLVGSRLDLAGEPVDEVTSDTDPSTTTWEPSPLLHRYAVLHAARILGAVRSAVDRTAAYCRERHQFGRPILSFQLVSAELGDAYAELLLLEAVVGRAVLASEDETHGYAAAAVADRVASKVARTAHQLHGAIGVTQEQGLDRVTRPLWAWPDRVVSTPDWERLATSGGEELLWSQVPE